MAIVQTDLTLVRKYIPYTGLTQSERAQSGIVRAEFQYYVLNASVPATGAGDSRLVKASLTLPGGYGYTIADAYVDLTQSGDNPSFEALAHLQVQPAGVLGPNIIIPMESPASRQDFSGTTPIGDVPAFTYNANFPTWRGNYGSQTYVLRDKPTVLLYDYEDGKADSLVAWSVGEQVQQQPATDVNLFLRFLQYDVDQSYNYVINTPQLTR